jgi:deoxyadenosine/deoxycytidine kinase
MILQEPVSEWCNVRGHNLLALLYEDLNRYNFMFQNYVQLSRMKTQMHHTNRQVLMFERSLQNNRSWKNAYIHKLKI